MKEIIDVLNFNEYYGGNDYIEIAKGKYELTYKPKGVYNKFKRWFIKILM